MRLRFLGILLLLLLAEGFAQGQVFSGEAARAVARADSLHRAYCFQEALNQYLAVPGAFLSDRARALLDRKTAASQHALNMTEFCAQPHVVARKRFSRKDFHLYYPLKPQAWRDTPNPLDSLGGFPLYFPADTDVVYYSAPDRAGTRSLFLTEDLDSAWRAPRLAGEALLSTGSEVFPMLSPDGNTLYFASDGLSGMGGYDLFASAWDPETASWSDPVNLGFPFNSPADDFLLVDTADGDYTLFASNRDCSPDSVCVYVLEYEKIRARKAVHSPEELRKLAALKPVEDPARIDNELNRTENVPSNDNTRLYMEKMQESRALMDSITVHSRIPGDPALADFRRALAAVSAELRRVEQSFLETGIVSNAEDQEVVGADLGYAFTRNHPGPRLEIRLLREPRRPSFRVAPVGRFAQDHTLPPGLVYQIEVFTSPVHATVEDLRGLSPVYERLNANLRYTYSVGLFSTYNQALLELNTVRCLGFPEARIAAFRDGRAIPVRTAREEE